MITGGYATVYITDMDRAVAFYVDVLGLKLGQRFANHWAEVRAGDNLLIGLHPKTDHAPVPGTSGAISIGLAIDEAIDGVVRRLSAKGVRFRGPVVRDAVHHITVVQRDRDHSPIRTTAPVEPDEPSALGPFPHATLAALRDAQALAHVVLDPAHERDLPRVHE